MYGAPATVDKPWFSFQFVEKAGSARWRVAKRPSLVNGTCKVMISASLAIVSKDTNPPSPSCSARGGSLRSTRIPMASHSLSTILPTWPTPTIPIVFPASLSPLRRATATKEDNTYCPTEAALQPGAFFHVIPAFSQ